MLCLSNPIAVTRLTGDECDKPCVANAGKLMVNPAQDNQCLDNGIAVISAAHVAGNDPVVPDGFSLIYVLTKGDNLVIQGTNADPVFNILEAGKFTIHTLVYDPNTLDLGVVVPGVTTGGDVIGIISANDLCADLDAAGAMYTIKDCTPTCDLDPPKISTDDDTNICADDGKADNINVSVSGGTAGTHAAWVITDENGVILDLPSGPPFNFEGAGAGTCLIWYLIHDGSLTGAAKGNNANTDLGGCYELSNAIAVVRNVDCGPDPCEVDGGTISTDDPTTICVDGVADPINVTVTGSKGDNALWLITDDSDIILASPAGPPFNLDPAGPGVCKIWYVRYNGDITGADEGKDIKKIEAVGDNSCVDLSNAIVVTRNDAPSITDVSSTASDECVDGGKNGTATVTVSGGSGSYDIKWSDGQTAATVVGLAPGSYGVTVTDANGCSDEATVTVDGISSGVCIGDYVWNDSDRDGLQGQYERGVEDVKVVLIKAGADGVYCTGDDITVATTETDSDGLYEFCCLAPGEYSIVFDPHSLPIDFIFTAQNAGDNDVKDSDADAVSGKTDPFTITAGQGDDYSFDAGIRRECINIEDGGTIGEDQTICRGSTPDAICVTVSPSGGSGDIEYLWMTTDTEGAFDPDTWTAIEGANGMCYQPGELFSTRYYILCSRRAGCDAYTGESNIVKITVTDCRREFIDFDANVMGTKEVNISWKTSLEERGFTYEVERSFDGVVFQTFNVMLGYGPGEAVNEYSVMDANPKNGHNFYRIKLIDNFSNVFYSDIMNVVLMENEGQEVLVYPNPIRNDKLTLETIDPLSNASTIKVLSASGKVLREVAVDAGAIQHQLNFDEFPAGLYFIQINFTDSKSQVIKVSKAE